MRKALTVILAVCILLSTVSVSASEDVYVKISQLYLEKRLFPYGKLSTFTERL